MKLQQKIIEMEQQKTRHQQLLIDIVNAALNTRFLNKKPHFLIQVGSIYIDIFINESDFHYDTILRDTAIDTGILINQISNVISNLGYNPIVDCQLIEKDRTRIARISLGPIINDSVQKRLSYGHTMLLNVTNPNVPQSDQLLGELQGQLIDRQIYVQKIIPDNSKKTPQFSIIGAFYHLGGWLEVGMAIQKAIVETNAKKTVNLYPVSGLKVPFDVQEIDRKRGRTLLMTIGNNGRKSANLTHNLMDYLISEEA